MKWLLLLAFFSTCNNKGPVNTMNSPVGNLSYQTPLTPDHLVDDLVNHPAFKGFGDKLLPWDNNSSYYSTSLKDVGSLMPYHSHVRPDIVLSAINYMITEVVSGKTIFYNFYSHKQKNRDPSLVNTGLFFFRGRPGAPFAIVCPGGGFSYVGSLHEGFPLAQEISRNGFNAFVLRYRTGSEQMATHDLAAAANDGIANVNTVERRVENLKSVGVDVEFRRYESAGHGFGTAKELMQKAGWIKPFVFGRNILQIELRKDREIVGIGPANFPGILLHESLNVWNRFQDVIIITAVVNHVC